ncbi:OLC1v1019293C1 [Oldenlandia corymbosa var. corymbosa]|uniref:OLC1v1019293C1 n=1 Tax=Oldenlandia corymbosa var. corymbosa TaxID=529605 RepID=A0AAV1EDN6_OLDCO|nr:OLC1v1019293C1 [Oldenlandia corymbosa var. corymbosa]
MTAFPLPIVALADTLTAAVTLPLIAQLAETLLMTIATLRVTPVIATSIQTLPMIVVAFAGFVSPIAAVVEIAPVVVGSVLQMDRLAQIALGMVESAEVTPMVVVSATMAVMASHSTALLSDRSVETPLMMISAGVASVMTKPVGSIRMATEYPDTPSATNMTVGYVPMQMLFADVVTASVGSALLLNHYSDTESIPTETSLDMFWTVGYTSVIDESVKTLSGIVGTASITTPWIVSSTDRPTETSLAVFRTDGYVSVIADSAVAATTVVERSLSAAETIRTHDQKL